MRMRVAKICPPVNKPTRLISPKSSGPEVGLLSGDYCITVFDLSLNQTNFDAHLYPNGRVKTNVLRARAKSQ